MFGIDANGYEQTKKDVTAKCLCSDTVREQQSGSLSSMRKWSAGDSQG